MFNTDDAAALSFPASLSWWFWIKAGLGLSIGVGIASGVLFAVQMYVLGPAGMLILKLFSH